MEEEEEEEERCEPEMALNISAGELSRSIRHEASSVHTTPLLTNGKKWGSNLIQTTQYL